jgi:PKD repeat protein
MVQQPSGDSRDIVRNRLGRTLVLAGARVLSTFALAVSVVVPITARPALAETPCPSPAVGWDAAGDGQWGDAGNWTGDTVPTSGDDVCIPDGVTVTVSAPAVAGRLFSEGSLQVDQFQSLTLTGSSEVARIHLIGTLTGAGTLTILGSGSTWSDGRIENDVVVAPGADLEISRSDTNKTVTGSLTNSGTITQSGSRLRLGTAVNNGTWLLTYPFSATVMSGGAGASFTNNGLVERPAGAGDTLADIISSLPFIDRGSVAARDGLVQIANLVELGDGAVVEADTGTMVNILSADGATVGNATVDGDGAVEFRTGQFSLNGGATLTVVDAFVLRGGDIAGPGTMRITGEAAMIQGRVSGTAMVAPSGHLDIAPSSSGVHITGRLVNEGLVTQPAENLFAGSGHGAITNNALWQMTNTASLNFITRGEGGLAGSFVNNGTLEGSDVAGSTGLHSTVDLENNGTVAARHGVFRIPTASANFSGATLTGGRWEMRNGSSLVLPMAVTENAGELLFSGAGAGSAQLTGLTSNTGSVELSDGAAFTTVGDFVNSGTIEPGSAGSLDVSGSLTLAATSTVDFGIGGTPGSGRLGTIHVAGPATLDGTLAAHVVDGYVPGVGDAHSVMTYQSMIGGFTGIATDPFYDADVQATVTYLVGLDPVPIADAGPDRQASEGDHIALDGTQSTDPGGAITSWHWTPGSWFESDSVPTPTFIHTPDDGPFVVSLEVCDAAMQCDSDDVTIILTNVDPALLPSEPLSVDEGTPMPAGTQLAAFTDPGTGDTHTSMIDWGDGSGEPGPADSPIVGSHTYPASGTYMVTVTVVDDDGGSDQATVHVTVANVAPTVVPGAPMVDEGDGAATILATVDDPGIETFIGSMNWADGSPIDPAVTVDPARRVLGGHAYADNGTYPASLCITDADGDSGCATVDVVVDNVPPTIGIGQSSLNGVAGTALSVTGTYQDPGAADTHTASIDWHDGSVDLGVPVAAGSFSFDHTFTSAGTFPVEVCVRDDDGGSDCDAVSVEVVPPANTPPTVDPGGPYVANEGVPITIVGGASDPDDGDRIVSTRWSAVPEAAFDDPHATRTTFLALQDGSYDITLSATDTHDATTGESTRVDVRNVPPTLTSRVFESTDEGSAVHLHATFSDPGALDLHTAHVNWFDGSGLAPAVVDEDANTIDASHVYPQDGQTEVNLCVGDELATFCNATHIGIENVPPAIQPFTLTGTQAEGSAVGLTATIVDPGTLDPLTARLDWGEGSGLESIAVTRTATGGTAVSSHRYQQDGLYTIQLCATDDDETTCHSEQITIVEITPDVDAAPDVTVEAGARVAPVADAGGPYSGDEGTPVRLDGSGSSDEDGMIVSYHWSGAGGEFDDPNSPTPSFMAVDNRTYTITLEVTDDDGTTDTAQATIEVHNVEPTVDAGKDKRIDNGAQFALDATFTDPGADTHSASVEWGDGKKSKIDPARPPVKDEHRYDKPGRYTVRVTVIDDDGGTGTDTVVVTVGGVHDDEKHKKDEKDTGKGDKARHEKNDRNDDKARHEKNDRNDDKSPHEKDDRNDDKSRRDKSDAGDDRKRQKGACPDD